MLKNDSKTNNFSYLIAKARVHSRYFFKNKKICNYLVNNSFPTPKSSLELVSIIRTDTL